jgi:hypothetical protein
MCVLKIFFWDHSKCLEMSLQYFKEKISLYQNVFLSKYCVPKCRVCISPKAHDTRNIFGTQYFDDKTF